jgi:hypothetical protein
VYCIIRPSIIACGLLEIGTISLSSKTFAPLAEKKAQYLRMVQLVIGLNWSERAGSPGLTQDHVHSMRNGSTYDRSSSFHGQAAPLGLFPPMLRH